MQDVSYDKTPIFTFTQNNADNPFAFDNSKTQQEVSIPKSGE